MSSIPKTSQQEEALKPFVFDAASQKKVRGIFRHGSLLKLKAKLYFIDTLDTFKFLVCHEKQ